jgi:hypothetical protein
MRLKICRLILVLCPLLATAACSVNWGPGGITQDQDARLRQGLAYEVIAGRATVQRQHGRVTVHLADQSLFARDQSDLSDEGRYVLTDVIDALVDPGLLRVEVAGSSAPATGLQAARVQAVTQYLQQPTQYPLPYELAQIVRPAAPIQGAQSATLAPGFTIVVSKVRVASSSM